MMSFLWRLVVNSILLWSILRVYAAINDSPPGSPTVLTMPSWVPFWPAFTPVYLAMLAIPWLLPLAIRDTWRFFACWLGMMLAYILAIALFLAFPTSLPRPSIPHGWGAGLYRGLAAIDPPNNVMPCAHGIGPVVVAWFVVHDRPTWRWPLVGMLVVGLPSIALVWQHRPIHIVVGIAIAALGIAAGEALNRCGRNRVSSPFIPF